MEGAIFLDRDGVLNFESGDYITRKEDLQSLSGALEAVAKLTQAGWRVFVYTNQSGVGRGYMSLEELNSIHAHLQSKAEEAGGKIIKIYACTHHPEAGCDCRKPAPGLLRQAAQEYEIDLYASYAVGDSPREIAAAYAAGCIPALVLSGHTKQVDPEDFTGPVPDHVFNDLSAFVEWLLPPDKTAALSSS
jgi:D-glycero-D-manno-heptose 1,7-bisphosphate phosphatase